MLEFQQQFDVSVLMGLFDYISDSRSLLQKLNRDTNKIILASFPKLWNILTLQRRIRYYIRKCPIFFYTKRQINNKLNGLGFDNFNIMEGQREYFVKIIVKD